jgi:hypothetical protein
VAKLSIRYLPCSSARNRASISLIEFTSAAHPAPLDQPAVPQMVEVVRAPDSDHRPQLAELARAAVCGQIRVGQDLHAPRHSPRHAALSRASSPLAFRSASACRSSATDCLACQEIGRGRLVAHHVVERDPQRRHVGLDRVTGDVMVPGLDAASRSCRSCGDMAASAITSCEVMYAPSTNTPPNSRPKSAC